MLIVVDTEGVGHGIVVDTVNTVGLSPLTDVVYSSIEESNDTRVSPWVSVCQCKFILITSECTLNGSATILW